MQTILGILLYSGYVPLPYRKMYWEQQQDVNKLLYAINTIPCFRSQFEEIVRYIHMCDTVITPDLVPVTKSSSLYRCVQQ